MDEVAPARQPGKLSDSRLKRFRLNQADNILSPAGGEVRQASKNKKAFQKYEALNIFKEPVQLIFVDETKRIRFNDEAIAELQKVDHDVNVVAVVGLYRTGKSLLLNRLAKVNNAFDIGHTSNAKTMGVWIMCLPHPTQESQVLILLDTEGLGAVLEVKNLCVLHGRYRNAFQDKLLEDRWHFLLATLLSSTLVYNHKGVLDSDAIQKLTFLKDIKSSVSILASDEKDDSYLDVFFPSLVMVIRDNILEITDSEDKPITADQYFENALALKSGMTDSIREYNLPRQLIRRYFKDRRCFMFSTPKNFRALSEGISSRNIEFENDVKSFTEHIYQCKPKQMTSGKPLNGRMFGSLVRSYVRCVQEGKPPCVHMAVKEMIEYENQNLVLAAQNVYKVEMQHLIGGALPDTETMTQFHLQSTDKAIEYLRKVIIYDDVELFTGTAMTAFDQVLEILINSVTKDSGNICWGRLQHLDAQRIQKKITHKAYQHVSGYDEYIKDVEWVIEQYNRTFGLGPQKHQVLQSYLDGKEDEENLVYGMVKESHEGRSEQNSKPIAEINEKHSLRRLSQTVDRGTVFEYLQVIREDQSIKRKQLTENLQTIRNEKTREYERQVREGFESASITEQENQRFLVTFLQPEDDLANATDKRIKKSKCNIL